MSRHADLIANVEELRQLVIAFAQRVLAHIDLQPRPSIRDDEETCLAKTTNAHDAAGGNGLDSRCFQIGARLRAVDLHQLRDGVRGVELMRVRGKAKASDRLEVGLALLCLYHFRAHQSPTNPSSLSLR